MDIKVREARTEDIESILKIYSQPSIDHGEILKIDRAKEIFEIINRYPLYKIYVATVNGEVVGTVAVLIMHNLGHLGKKSAVFESIAVLPEWQGKGIGRFMLKYATDKCIEADCYKITLSADIKRERAHKFYESLGFIQHGFSYMRLI